MRIALSMIDDGCATVAAVLRESMRSALAGWGEAPIDTGAAKVHSARERQMKNMRPGLDNRP